MGGGCWQSSQVAPIQISAPRPWRTGNLQRDQVDTDSFVLTRFYRITRPDLPLTVYIEGDGMAWRSRTTPAENPTPHQALGLALAVADPAANVVT